MSAHWVISGHRSMSAPCPLYPQKWTFTFSLRLMRNSDFIERLGAQSAKGSPFLSSELNTAVGQLASHDRRPAMPLQRGEVRSYNFNRMAVEFTMVNQGKVIPCSISTAAMDDLEGRRPGTRLTPAGNSNVSWLRNLMQPLQPSAVIPAKPLEAPHEELTQSQAGNHANHSSCLVGH
jgi:hypothetical protein